MTPRVIVEPARLAGRSLMRCQTDERLVDLARAGNERAFEAIVDRYALPLQRYCTRLLPPARAEDVVQQTFVNAYAALHRDDRRIDLRPWLYRIAHNAALNALRENGWSHEQLETALAGTETTHDAVERRARLEVVLNAVQMLPERQRDAMILRELEGRTYEQIATELDATGGAVRQLLNRARHTVRAAATALTPAGALVRLQLTGSAVVERVSDATVHESLRLGASRIAGGVVAGLAVAAGLSEAPDHLHVPRIAHPGGGAPRQAVAARPWTATPSHLVTGHPVAVAHARGRTLDLPARVQARLSPRGTVVLGVPRADGGMTPRATPTPPAEQEPLAPAPAPAPQPTSQTSVRAEGSAPPAPASTPPVAPAPPAERPPSDEAPPPSSQPESPSAEEPAQSPPEAPASGSRNADTPATSRRDLHEFPRHGHRFSVH
jgi:RNA polymerase sigma factor (sigma-70 family)